MVLLLAQGLAIFVFFHALLARADGNRSFSWDLMNHVSSGCSLLYVIIFYSSQESERVSGLTVCDGLHISLAPLSNHSDVGRAPYTVLAFEVGGVLTTTQVHEDGLWQVKHRGGSYQRSFVQIIYRAEFYRISTSPRSPRLPGEFRWNPPHSFHSCM
jgi:hypothetical protein